MCSGTALVEVAAIVVRVEFVEIVGVVSFEL
jgi:hypothetical protein